MKSHLVPVEAAAVVVASFQLLVAWFILGNDEVLLRLTPITLGAVVVGDLLTYIGSGTQDAALWRRRLAHVAILAGIVGFLFLAAVGTSRGQDPIGQPPELTEWGLAVGVAIVGAFGKALQPEIEP